MPTDQKRYIVDFLLIDNFSLISFASALEPLRIANKLLRSERFDYRCLSVAGESVAASNGIPIPVQDQLANITRADLLVICSSDNVESVKLPDSVGADLRRLERHGTPLTAICTGAYILAKFGLLRDRACTIHWEYVEIFNETFPEADLQQSIFMEDRGLMTSSGGTAPLDLMTRIVQQVAGEQVARDVSDIAIHHAMRDETVPQRLNIQARYGATNPTFVNCVRIMEDNIETPLSLDHICSELNISARQLQRLFKQHVEGGPRAFYEGLRVERARQMLRRTSMTVSEIAVASGFTSTNSFSHAYKRVYQVTPTKDRRN